MQPSIVDPNEMLTCECFFNLYYSETSTVHKKKFIKIKNISNIIYFLGKIKFFAVD